MNFKNANIYTSRFCFEKGAFSVVDGKFANVLGEAAEDAIDLHRFQCRRYDDGIFDHVYG